MDLAQKREVLLKAADLIDHGGLSKYTRQSRSPTGMAHCIHGAVSMVLYENPFGYMKGNGVVQELEVTGLLADFLRRRGVRNVDGQGCAEWNNAPERTKEEVVSAMREAAYA